MTLHEIANRLQAKRNDTIKNGWTADQTRGDETYGLNYAKVQEVAREMHHDAVLADELYASSNHDMKVLATFIDDPKSYTLDELTQRANQLYPSPFAEKFCKQVLAHSVHAVYFVDKWLACEDCNLQAYAYITLSEIAKRQNKLSDVFFAMHLDAIALTFTKAPADVQYAMKCAAESIAGRNERLRAKAQVSEALLSLHKAPGNKKTKALATHEKSVAQSAP
jgi:hypothetical protein